MQHVVEKDLSTEMHESYLQYAMSVIKSRALPDIRDGLKPSQRRVLYAFGHQHLGMTLSAITAELIEALVTGAAPAVDLAPFRVERFG